MRAFDFVIDDEFEKMWWKLIQRFELTRDEWIQCLYADRQRWVLVYFSEKVSKNLL